MDTKLRELFQSAFNHEKYRKLVIEGLLHCKQAFKQPELLDDDANGDVIYGLGRTTDIDGKEIGFYYTKVSNSDVTRKRVGFHKMMQPYVKYGVDAAIAVFDDGVHWRLSYISDLKGGATSAKRFSYVVGDPAGHYNTPSHRLAQLGTLASHLRLSDIYDAFSVEALSKEFFDGYHRHYDRILKALADSITDPNKDAVSNAANKNIANFFADYVKKMMGRIVFLHFLQKKGWLNGNQDFLRDLFFMQPLDRRADFLERVLEPLFFGIFNTEVANREKVFRDNGWDLDLLEQWKALPYLNGGLFERDGHDMATLKLPASLFEDLFSFMASYNFTVDENDPDDAEVGVDPEMLGKIFESLLEDNKAKGAFYTPKEIVRYMCKESLIAYLTSKVNSDSTVNVLDGHNLNNPTQGTQCGDGSSTDTCVPEARDISTAIRAFVETHEMQPELEPCRDTLDTALREVKICDPAIGSGAFPMGLLNELWRCREAIEETSSRVELKKEIIENNIYGVDIEKGAIDIARLRFWLSIVVDAEEPEPLPNFDYKFMQGNSLIESYKGFDLSRISNRLRGGQSKSTQLLLGLDSDFSKKNLQRLMRDYFSVTDHKQKASMHQAINDEVKRLITDFIGGTSSDLDKLAPSANQDFFLWHTWFKDIFDNGGFDIVIGNPPYKIVERGDGNKLFYDEHYAVAHGGKRNLYHLFFERGINIAQHNSVLSYITPDTYFSGNDTSFLRKYLIENTAIKSIIHYTEKDKIFENVTQAVAVIVLTKHQPGQDFTIFSHGNSVTIKYRTLDKSNGWIFKASNSVIEKMKLCITTFDKVCIGYKGDVNLGLKKSFFRTTPMINSLPLVRGVQINKFSYVKGNEYCLKQALSKDQTSRQRIVFQEVANMGLKHRVKGTVLSDVICGDSCNIIFPKDDSIDIMYMLGILNSKAVNYFFKYFNQTNHVPIGELKRIPFPVINKDEQRPIIDLTKRILALKDEDQNADTTSLENEIDKLVYQLYNLTPEEIAVIEK